MIFDIFMVVAACTVFAIGCEAWTAMLLNVEKLRVSSKAREAIDEMDDLSIGRIRTAIEKELTKKNDKRKRK